MIHRKPCATCGAPMSVKDAHSECNQCRHPSRFKSSRTTSGRECPGCGRPLSLHYEHETCRTCRGEDAQERPEPPEVYGHEPHTALAALNARVAKQKRQPHAARFWR